jgi:hypothetical protein
MRIYIVFCAALFATAVGAGAAERMRFWNLTGGTVTELSLTPAGTENWGPINAETILMVPLTTMSG